MYISRRYVKRLVKELKKGIKNNSKDCDDMRKKGNLYLEGVYVARIVRDQYYLDMFEYMLKNDGLF